MSYISKVISKKNLKKKAVVPPEEVERRRIIKMIIMIEFSMFSRIIIKLCQLYDSGGLYMLQVKWLKWTRPPQQRIDLVPSFFLSPFSLSLFPSSYYHTILKRYILGLYCSLEENRSRLTCRYINVCFPWQPPFFLLVTLHSNVT